MALEQAAEGADQQFALVEDIASLLDGAVHGQEAVDQVAIAEHVAGEVRHLLDAEPFSHLIERGLCEVERAIAPTLAPAHPPGLPPPPTAHEHPAATHL